MPVEPKNVLEIDVGYGGDGAEDPNGLASEVVKGPVEGPTAVEAFDTG